MFSLQYASKKYIIILMFFLIVVCIILDIFWHCSNTEASQKHPKLKLLFVTVALYYGSVVSSARTAFLLSLKNVK